MSSDEKKTGVFDGCYWFLGVQLSKKCDECSEGCGYHCDKCGFDRYILTDEGEALRNFYEDFRIPH